MTPVSSRSDSGSSQRSGSFVPRVQFPYQPPQEYDYVVTFLQPGLRNGISLIMPNPNGGSFVMAPRYADCTVTRPMRVLQDQRRSGQGGGPQVGGWSFPLCVDPVLRRGVDLQHMHAPAGRRRTRRR